MRIAEKKLRANLMSASISEAEISLTVKLSSMPKIEIASVKAAVSASRTKTQKGIGI